MALLAAVAGCGSDEGGDVLVRNPALPAAADAARAAVRRAVALVPAEQVLEVAGQEDRESPCQEPPDDGADGSTQWVVSTRVFVRPGTDTDQLLDRLRGGFPGGRTAFDRTQQGERRVQLVAGDVTLTLGVTTAGGDNPQAVITSVTPCLRNGG